MKKHETKQRPAKSKSTHVTKAEAGRRAERMEAVLDAAYRNCPTKICCKITTVAFHIGVGYPAVRQWVTRGVPDRHAPGLADLSGYPEADIPWSGGSR